MLTADGDSEAAGVVAVASKSKETVVAAVGIG
jgi:hypothetical protein